MAILNTIRGKSSVLIIVIGMALFSFVFAELIKSGDSFGTEQSGCYFATDVFLETASRKLSKLPVQEDSQSTGSC